MDSATILSGTPSAVKPDGAEPPSGPSAPVSCSPIAGRNPAFASGSTRTSSASPHPPASSRMFAHPLEYDGY
ncbi:Uncharacterised protein [Mycobacteroides abscessus subsp. abscessus]|nr:Uncharacterised protein [Mycobacteroides abscessus subsp. abscessus]